MVLTAEQEAHVKRLTDLLAEAKTAKGETRARLLREAAEVDSDLRLTFQRSTKDSRPDIGGRSFAYQATKRDIFAAIGASDALRDALRYHMNIVHKVRFPADVLAEYGMDERTRLEQMEDRRNAERAAVAQARLQLSPLPAREQLRQLEMAQAILANLDVEGLRVLEGDERARATRVAGDIATVAERVARVSE